MRKIALLFMAVCSLLLAAGPALATSVNIFLDPSYQEIPVGGTASVELLASGQTDFGFGGFNLDIGYDSSIISIADVIFGTALGDPGIYASADTSVDGIVNLFEVADPFTFIDLSAAPITLATLKFTGIATGFSPLEFLNVDLSDAYLASINPADVTATGAGVSPVPEPTTMVLLGTGLVGLAGLGRKRSIRKAA